MNHPVYNEVAEAYYDSLHEWEESVDRRNLGFRASQSVSPQVAVEIMKELVPGYNEFEAELLGLLPDDCEVFIAREGSVCVYVKPGEKPLPSTKELKADEFSVMDRTTFGDEWHKPRGERDDRKTPYGGYEGEIRIWWD